MTEQACSILEEELGRLSDEFAQCLSDMASLHESQASYQEAREFYRRAIAIRRKKVPSPGLSITGDLNDLAQLYHTQGEYQAARSLFVEALDIRESALDPKHPDIAKSLNNLAVLDIDEGAYKQAELLLERALAIYEESLEPHHLDVGTTLNNLGMLYHHQGLYDKAEVSYVRALAISEKSLGPFHPDVAKTLNNLSSTYRVQGAYGKAEPLLKRALNIYEKTLGSAHQSTATGISNLATQYLEQGAYKKAEPLFIRASAIYKEALGPQHPLFAMSLNNLAMLHKIQGAYDEAEKGFIQALAISESVLGVEHPHLATCLGNLAGLYQAQGAYEKAKPLLERALTIHERALNPDHPNIALGLNNLATLYLTVRSYSEAEPLLDRALAIQERRLGPTHPSVANSLNNLAVLYSHQKMYKKATSSYIRSMEIFKDALGAEHPRVAMVMNNLAVLYGVQGAHEEAERLHAQSVAIYESTLGPHHPSLAHSTLSLAVSRHDRGEHDAAMKPHWKSLNIESENIAHVLVVASEGRRLSYASRLSRSLNYAISLHLQVAPDHGPIGNLALTAVLRRKGRVQDLVAQSNMALRNSLPGHALPLLDDLMDIESQIATQSSRGPSKTGGATFGRRLNELQEKKRDLWSKLAESSGLVEALSSPPTIEGVQQALSPNSALVEFVRYIPQHDNAGVHLRKHDPKPGSRYAAYLVFPDHFDWVDLGPAGPIEQHVRAFRKALQTKQTIPTDLYDAVMQPVVAILGSTDRVIIAPAGALSLVPFGALHDGTRYMVEKYELRYVTTGRDLLEPPRSRVVATNPVTIVANPAGAFLPDAELEAKFLEGVFPGTRILRAEQATETNVRAVERPLILHMATHGFFGEARNERDNPMFRSGLYMADIEQVEVDRQHDDGRLTAYEVSGMDLRGTQLVVLSACETGMGAAVMSEGKELMSEGMFGLRRAFVTAGARTTVMSLWEVSGATAQATTRAFYSKLAEGQGPGEAMQAVQLELLQTEEHAHPKDWAVFVVSGDDESLDFPAGQGPRFLKPSPEGPPPVGRGCGCQRASIATEPSPRDWLLFCLAVSLARRRRGRQ